MAEDILIRGGLIINGTRAPGGDHRGNGPLRVLLAPALPGKAETLARHLGPSAPWLDLRETTFAK